MIYCKVEKYFIPEDLYINTDIIITFRFDKVAMILHLVDDLNVCGRTRLMVEWKSNVGYNFLFIIHKTIWSLFPQFYNMYYKSDLP